MNWVMKPQILHSGVEIIRTGLHAAAKLRDNRKIITHTPLRAASIIGEVPEEHRIEKVERAAWIIDRRWIHPAKQKGVIVCTDTELILYAKGITMKIPFARIDKIRWRERWFSIQIKVQAEDSCVDIEMPSLNRGMKLYEYMIYKKYSV